MIIKTLASTCLALLICVVAHATTVYKWDDAEGKTIYIQTPPPAGTKFEIMDEKITGSARSVAKAQSGSAQSTLEQRREERIQDKTEREVIEESNRIKQENCTLAKKNLDSLTSRGQVTLKYGDVYRKLTEEERQAKTQETKSLVEEFCTG